jgi:hypothetical protein
VFVVVVVHTSRHVVRDRKGQCALTASFMEANDAILAAGKTRKKACELVFTEDRPQTC